jgi:hypothetical protein
LSTVHIGRILELARKHLDQGLCFDRTARITRATDAELVAFATALLAEHEASKLAPPLPPQRAP